MGFFYQFGSRQGILFIKDIERDRMLEGNVYIKHF